MAAMYLARIQTDTICFNSVGCLVSRSKCETRGRHWGTDEDRWRQMKTETLQLGLQAINACSKAFRWEDALQLLKHMATQKARSSGLLVSHKDSWNSFKFNLYFKSFWTTQRKKLRRLGLKLLRKQTLANSTCLYLQYFAVFVSRLVSLHSVVQVRANCISYSSCMSSCEWRVTFRLLDEMTTALIPPNDFISTQSESYTQCSVFAVSYLYTRP